jgi:acyl carrier protein
MDKNSKTMNANEQLLKNTLATVFNVPVDIIGEDSSMDTLSQWDSVKHLNLVLAVEDAFNISLTEEQSLEILSFPLIKVVLAEHGVNFS